MARPQEIECRRCGKRLRYRRTEDLPHFPFCSRRCKLLDLGQWFDEEHRITESLDGGASESFQPDVDEDQAGRTEKA